MALRNSGKNRAQPIFTLYSVSDRRNIFISAFQEQLRSFIKNVFFQCPLTLEVEFWPFGILIWHILSL